MNKVCYLVKNTLCLAMYCILFSFIQQKMCLTNSVILFALMSTLCILSVFVVLCRRRRPFLSITVTKIVSENYMADNKNGLGCCCIKRIFTAVVGCPCIDNLTTCEGEVWWELNSKGRPIPCSQCCLVKNADVSCPHVWQSYGTSIHL